MYTGLSKSTYYYQLSVLRKEDPYKVLKEHISAIHLRHNGLYGYRRIHLELKNQGSYHNKKLVQRLMNDMGLKGYQPKKRRYNSYKGEVGKVADNILKRDFSACDSNRKWTTDITEFKTLEGKLYLSPILDMFNSEIFSYDISDTPDFSQIERMLSQAFSKLNTINELILHSDQGWQYQMERYQDTIEAVGITQSMSHKGNCLDNAIMESFFGILKNETYYGRERTFKTKAQLRLALEQYITYYNEERIKVRLKGLAPIPYRLLHQGKG